MPRWGDVVELISISETTDEYGNSVPTETTREVFANMKSVRQSEFYQSMITDLKPEIMFDVRNVDYEDEDKLRFNGDDYNIIRAYTQQGEFVELVCEGLNNG